MSSYVNLIQPSEIKYHSVATDKRFLVKAGIGLFILFGLYAGWTAWTSFQSSGEARRIQEEWETVKPRYAVALQERKALVKLQNTQKYLESWAETRIPAAELLLEIAALLPPTVQATQLQITSQLVGLEGGIVRLGQAEITVPERLYKLQFKGLSHGADGEKVVFQLEDQMKKSAALSRWISSVKLQNSQKEVLAPDGVPVAGGQPLPVAAMTEEQLAGQTGKSGAADPSPAAAKPAEPATATGFTIECEFKPRVFAWPGKN